MIKVVVFAASGWTGSALISAIAAAKDMTLAGADARKAAGQDAGEANGFPPAGVKIVATLREALAAPSDVVVDYSHPSSVRAHVLEAVAAGRHAVVGTSGLGADDYAEIDKAAKANKDALEKRTQAAIESEEAVLKAAKADRDLIDRRYRKDVKPDDLAAELGTSRRTLFRNLDRVRRRLLECITRHSAAEPN